MADLILKTIWFEKKGNAYVRHDPGTVLEVEEAVADWLLRNGSADYAHSSQASEDDVDAEVQAPDTGDTDGDGEDNNQGDDEIGDAETDDSDPERPLNTAKRELWDAYALKKNVDPTKFKSKEELIAALPN